MNKLAKITGVALLSVGLLAGCQSKEEKLLQGKWENSSGAQLMKIEGDKITSIQLDGSKNVRDFEVEKGKNKNEIALYLYAEEYGGEKKEKADAMIYEVSDDKKTLTSKNSIKPHKYTKIED